MLIGPGLSSSFLLQNEKIDVLIYDKNLQFKVITSHNVLGSSWKFLEVLGSSQMFLLNRTEQKGIEKNRRELPILTIKMLILVA